jgi:hypothetical protein
MFIITATTVRTSTDSPFYSRPSEFKKYFDATFCRGTSTTCKGRISSISEDGLTKTVETHWVDQDAYDASVTDPLYLENLAPRKAHEEEQNHTFTIERRVE